MYNLPNTPYPRIQPTGSNETDKTTEEEPKITEPNTTEPKTQTEEFIIPEKSETNIFQTDGNAESKDTPSKLNTAILQNEENEEELSQLYTKIKTKTEKHRILIILPKGIKNLRKKHKKDN